MRDYQGCSALCDASRLKNNRVVVAHDGTHCYYTMSDYPVLHSETMAYNRNSAITSLTRTSNGQGYGNIDQLTYTYTGNRLKAISDAASPSVYNGGFEFVKKANHTQEYWYNTAGDLARDKNKGLALIEYDFFGNPTRIQFRNGNVTEYVYSAAGQKLKEKHTTAIDGLTVSYGQTLQLTPAQIMAVDSVDYAANWIIWKYYQQGPSPSFYSELSLDYHFDGGYLDIDYI